MLVMTISIIFHSFMNNDFSQAPVGLEKLHNSEMHKINFFFILLYREIIAVITTSSSNAMIQHVLKVSIFGISIKINELFLNASEKSLYHYDNH